MNKAGKKNRYRGWAAAAFLVIIFLILSTPVQAAETEGAGLWFDWNEDGETTQEDYDLARAWLEIYQMSSDASGETVPLNGNDEASESLRRMILQQIGVTGSVGTVDYDTDVSGIASYNISGDGLVTPVQSQDMYGTCWAFASNSAVESTVIRERLALLSEEAGSAWDSRLSAMYLASKAFMTQESGSQSGEGLSLRDCDASVEEVQRLLVGGFLSMAQIVYGNWDGPISEETEAYGQLFTYGDGSVHVLTETDYAGTDSVVAHLQDYYLYDAASITTEDAATQLRLWQGYDESAIETWKSAILQYGALAAMCATDSQAPDENGMGDFFNFRNWTQYYDDDIVTINHVVTIVGWDDSVPAEMFSDDPDAQPPGDGAWLVKNSWGSYDTAVSEYGQDMVDALLNSAQTGTKSYYLAQRNYNYGIPDEDGHGTGYFWISYYDKSLTCAAAAAGVDIADDGWDYDNNYTWQYAVSMTNAALVLPADNAETKVSNIFTAKGNELLTAVSAEAPVSGVTAGIEVYLMDTEDAYPTDGALVAAQTALLQEAGLHTIELEVPVTLAAGQRFAVVEKISSEYAAAAGTSGSALSGTSGFAAAGEGGSEAAVGSYTWLNLETAIVDELQTEDNYSGCVTTVVANEGETYAWVELADGSYGWVTPVDLNASASGSIFQYGNALIHAYTVDLN